MGARGRFIAVRYWPNRSSQPGPTIAGCRWRTGCNLKASSVSRQPLAKGRLRSPLSISSCVNDGAKDWRKEGVTDGAPAGIMELLMSKQLFATELSNREFFIRRWQREFPAFLDVCKALPPGKLEYRPHPQSRSAGELVALLVSVEQSCVDLCATGRRSYNSGLRFHPTSGFTRLEEMVRAYAASWPDLGSLVMAGPFDEPLRVRRHTTIFVGETA